MFSNLFFLFPQRRKTMVRFIGLLLFLGCCILVSSKTVLALNDSEMGTYTCREVFWDDDEDNFQVRLTLYPPSPETLKGRAECSKMYEVLGIWKTYGTWEWHVQEGYGDSRSVQEHIYVCMTGLHVLSGDCSTWTNWIKQ
jgi:hypothetical protein